MTRKVGFVQVPLTATEALSVAGWLRRSSKHVQGTATTDSRDDAGALTGLLIGRLVDAAKHRRSRIELPRDLARHAAALGEAALVRYALVRSAPCDALVAIRFALDCGSYARKRRGRPQRTPPRLRDRIAKAEGYKRDERELASAKGACLSRVRERIEREASRQLNPRKLRRLKRHERFEAWLERIAAKGETLLTASEPPPK